MHIFVIALWASIAVWFNPRLFALFSLAQSFPAALTLALFILCLNVFWLFGSYHIATFFFSLVSHRHKSAPPSRLPTDPRVAVLYLTSNDFQYQAALSCVQLAYADFHVFILDDSTDPDQMQEVDEFHDKFSDKTTVLRRDGRQGFKAGNLNHALGNHIIDFPYFAVIDADGVVPPDFLTRLMPYFALDESVAFVQGSHRPNPLQKSAFAADLAPGIIPLWSTYYPPRNRYGLVLFLGHGGIVRRDVWQLVDGFPEMLAEDLAFSTKVRECGFQGLFVDDVCSYEDFPESYRRLRRQQQRYIQGGCQYVGSGLLKSFLKSRSPTWLEKTDLLLWISTLFSPLVYVFFLIVLAVLMPLSFAESRTLQVSFLGFDVGPWAVFPLSDDFYSIWTCDFYVVTIAMIFAPVLGSVRRLAQHPWETVKSLFMSSVPYLSMTLVSVVWVISYLVGRRVEWEATGEAGQMPMPRDERNGRLAGAGDEPSRLNRNVVALEIVAGTLLTAACVLTMNIVLLVFTLSLLMGPIVQRVRWEKISLAAVLPMPHLLLCLAMGNIGANLWGVQAASYLLFPLHF